MATIGAWEENRIYCADGIAFMWSLPKWSVDMICGDMPYGTTQCAWDSIMNLREVWRAVQHCTKPNGVIALTSDQPFTSVLNCSNLEMFRFEYSWHKVRVTGHLNAKKRPLKAHENISVFSADPDFKYYPQTWRAKEPKSAGRKAVQSAVYGKFGEHYSEATTKRQPTSVLTFSIGANERGLYPTQKPLDLFKYLIRQHSQEGDLILDFCIGSGTTGLAALETGRRFIGCDTSMEAVEIARRRCSNFNMPMFDAAHA